ncbi:MAG: ABC transporter permease [Acidobacteriota bacterium]|nr:ABC transporter permease [Acidobacteriota bacterium]
MSSIPLTRRSLAHYRRTHLAVVVGVAVAVAVLTGSLLVGDSVRGSLRQLALQRLGAAHWVITSSIFFREALAEEMAAHPDFVRQFGAVCPLLVQEGWLTQPETGLRAAGVSVYGVDERFWRFQGVEPDPDFGSGPRSGRRVLLSPEAARDLGAEAGSPVLLRLEQPSNVPRDSLHGRRDRVGRTLRLSVSGILEPSHMGEFSLSPRQGPVRAVFVPLRRLQRDLEVPNRINTLLVSRVDPGRQPASDPARPDQLAGILRDTYSLEDTDLKLRVLDGQQCLSVETEGTLIGEGLAVQVRNAAEALGLRTRFLFTYLANTIRTGGREIPYSLVTALDFPSFGLPPTRPGDELPPVALNRWAARDLQARPGDLLELEYYLWAEQGRLLTRSARFRLSEVVPMEGSLADRDLAPAYPGITESRTLVDWDPPFPMELGRIRPRDEDYWEEYRTTPKAFIPLEVGQELWRSRHGRLSSIRVYPSAEAPAAGPEALQGLRSRLESELKRTADPAQFGFSLRAVGAQAEQASRGVTDFGQYFVYFSFFLVVSALLLTSLFFKLGVEQRVQEIGLLRALGFDPAGIRRLFLREGALLAGLGTLLGLAGALGYTALIMLGLRTWWVDAVGTTQLRLDVSGFSLLAGGLGGILTALICIAWSLRRMVSISPRSLLTGSWLYEEAGATAASPASGRKSGKSGGMAARWRSRGRPRNPDRSRSALLLAAAAVAFLLASLAGGLSRELGFFASGTLCLLALLAWQSGWLRRTRRPILQPQGGWAVSRLGFRNATVRPGRSLLCIALIASATFIIVTVEAFRRTDRSSPHDRQSGTGGFTLVAESLLPIQDDLNSTTGREAMNLSSDQAPTLADLAFSAFRLRPGDDASCLNLYQPSSPRILGAPDAFLSQSRFRFQASLSSPHEPDNPWRLLHQELPGNVIPVIADANSMQYVLHRQLGEELVLNPQGEAPLRLRLVGALQDSLFQSELIMSEKHFLRAFPRIEGFRFFLMDTPPGTGEEVTATLEDRLSDYGFDVAPTAVRLAAFHRVNNTYLSTFQALGGMGLLLGTFGLGVVLLRNVLERRREFALMTAVGYHSGHLARLVISENLLLLGWGLLFGVFSAAVAIVPAWRSTGGHLSLTALAWLLLAVLAAGLISSLAAVRAVTGSPVAPALRAD